MPQHFVWLVLAYADDSESAAVVSYAMMDLRRVVSMSVVTTKVAVQDNPVMVERVIGTIDLGTGREGMLLTRGHRATNEAGLILQTYIDALPAHEAADAATVVADGLTERLFGP